MSLLLVILILMFFVFYLEPNIPRINEYTALQWANKAGIKGSRAKSAVAPTLAFYKMKGKMYRIERAGKIYWGLKEISEDEVIKRMREITMQNIMLGLPEVTVEDI